MSRSNYVDCDYGEVDILMYGRWRGQVASAIRGSRGQIFLKELAAAMDAMPEKALIADELVDEGGNCCTIGVVCKARGISVRGVDVYESEQVGKLVGIAHQMAAEIEHQNDECGRSDETPEQRWIRMRKWVEENLNENKEVK